MKLSIVWTCKERLYTNSASNAIDPSTVNLRPERKQNLELPQAFELLLFEQGIEDHNAMFANLSTRIYVESHQKLSICAHELSLFILRI